MIDRAQQRTNVREACLLVLLTGDARAKAECAQAVVQRWREGVLALDQDNPVPGSLPDRPARPEAPALLAATKMPKRRIGSARGKLALLHALAHIELNAIDLAFDMLARFLPDCRARSMDLTAFADDWMRVGAEEAKHFLLLDDRLRELGSFYGDLPAHDGLWEAAIDTKNDWAARLAVVPMVLEARGLDVSPNTVKSLKDSGDKTSADILQTIYEEEIGHVEIGTRWFKRICAAKNVDAVGTYQKLIQQHFKGTLKPPFNDKARSQAGLLPNFYRPLAE